MLRKGDITKRQRTAIVAAVQDARKNVVATAGSVDAFLAQEGGMIDEVTIHAPRTP
jgi:hypothetical protein